MDTLQEEHARTETNKRVKYDDDEDGEDDGWNPTTSNANNLVSDA